MRKKIFYMVIMAVSMTSCDAAHRLSGTIISSSNRLPIDSVKICRDGFEDMCLYTDSLGNFKLYYMSSGMWFVPDHGVQLSICKDGYKPLNDRYKECKDKPVVIVLSEE